MIWTRALVPIALGSMLAAGPSAAADLVVYHNWGSPAELSALNVLREALEVDGHTWTPLVIPHDANGDINVVDLIDAGARPNVFLQLQPDVYRTLDARGQVLHLDEQLSQSGVLAQLPPVVRDAITIDGHIVRVPATIHADAMLFYNRAVAQASGIDPESWVSLDDMWRDFADVQAAGFQPLAIGAQPWQIGYITHALVASLGGEGVYDGLYGVTLNPAVLDDSSLLTVFSTLRRFADHSDPGAVTRDWNLATSMVIGGQALLQLQGDWMKGEWRAAGKVEGEDFGCLLIPGALHLPVTVDGWGLLGGVSSDDEAAERDFADVVTDADVQARFAQAKGSTPVRLDARSGIDHCSHEVLDALDRPGFAVPTPHSTASPDRVAAIWSVANSFWADSAMSPEQGVAALKSALAAL